MNSYRLECFSPFTESQKTLIAKINFGSNSLVSPLKDYQDWSSEVKRYLSEKGDHDDLGDYKADNKFRIVKTIELLALSVFTSVLAYSAAIVISSPILACVIGVTGSAIVIKKICSLLNEWRMNCQRKNSDQLEAWEKALCETGDSFKTDAFEEVLVNHYVKLHQKHQDVIDSSDEAIGLGQKSLGEARKLYADSINEALKELKVVFNGFDFYSDLISRPTKRMKDTVQDHDEKLRNYDESLVSLKSRLGNVERNNFQDFSFKTNRKIENLEKTIQNLNEQLVKLSNTIDREIDPIRDYQTSLSDLIKIEHSKFNKQLALLEKACDSLKQQVGSLNDQIQKLSSASSDPSLSADLTLSQLHDVNQRTKEESET